MAKVRVRTAAVFNGQPVGSEIEIEKALAEKYAEINWLTIIGEVKTKKAKPKTTSKKSKSATKKTENKGVTKVKAKGKK